MKLNLDSLIFARKKRTVEYLWQLLKNESKSTETTLDRRKLRMYARLKARDAIVSVLYCMPDGGCLGSSMTRLLC